MIERLKPMIILFCLLTIGILGCVHKSWAQESQLQNKLNEIKQVVDKQAALKTLFQLIQSPALDTGEKAEIYLSQGKTLFSLHQYDEGINVVNKAIGLSKKANRPNLEA